MSGGRKGQTQKSRRTRRLFKGQNVKHKEPLTQTTTDRQSRGRRTRRGLNTPGKGRSLKRCSWSLQRAANDAEDSFERASDSSRAMIDSCHTSVTRTRPGTRGAAGGCGGCRRGWGVRCAECLCNKRESRNSARDGFRDTRGNKRVTFAVTHRQTFLYCVFMDSLYIYH